MSEEVPIRPTINMAVVFVEGDVPKKEEVFVDTNTSMEEFFDGSNVIVEAMASATTAATGEVFVEASISLVEPDLVEGVAFVEEKILEQSGPTFAKFSTPPKGGASPMGS